MSNGKQVSSGDIINYVGPDGKTRTATVVAPEVSEDGHPGFRLDNDEWCFADQVINIISAPGPVVAPAVATARPQMGSSADRVVKFLTDEREATIPDIADALGMPIQTVRAVILYGAWRDLFVHARTSGRTKLWALK